MPLSHFVSRKSANQRADGLPACRPTERPPHVPCILSSPPYTRPRTAAQRPTCTYGLWPVSSAVRGRAVQRGPRPLWGARPGCRGGEGHGGPLGDPTPGPRLDLKPRLPTPPHPVRCYLAAGGFDDRRFFPQFPQSSPILLGNSRNFPQFSAISPQFPRSSCRFPTICLEASDTNSLPCWQALGTKKTGPRRGRQITKKGRCQVCFWGSLPEDLQRSRPILFMHLRKGF